MLNFYVKEWHYFFVSLYLFGLNIGLLAGQIAYKPEYAYTFTESWRWQNIDALEGCGVQAIFEDSNGILWVSTDTGIREYDGYSWVAHALSDENPKPVIQIAEAPDGTLYATTSTQIFHYTHCSWQTFFQLEISAGMAIHSIIATKNNEIFAATNWGVIQITGDLSSEITFYSTSSARKHLSQHLVQNPYPVRWIDLPEALVADSDSIRISHVLETSDGTLWFAANTGREGKLLKFTPLSPTQKSFGEYQIFHSTPECPLGPEQKIIQSRDGKIWIINDSFNLGVSVFDGKNWKHIRLSDEVGGDEFTTDISETSDGTIWFGAIGKAYALKNHRWFTFKAPEYHVPANRIKFFSGQKNFWIFGLKSRVNRIDYSNDRWATFPRLNFQCQDSEGKNWFIETDGRVITEKDGIWNAWDTVSGLMDTPIKLIATSRGQIWAGGSDQGIAATSLFDSGKWYTKHHPGLSWGIDYRAMFEAEDGSIWFGSSVDLVRTKGHLGGVIQLLNPQSFPHKWISHPENVNGLAQSNAYGIAQSKDGRIWIGGSNLFGFDGKKWEPAPDPRLHSFINTVHSKDGFLVAGTRLYGIFTFDGISWKNYNINSGLTSNTIISVFAESDSLIWAVTEDDLCRFDGTKWTCGFFPSEMNMPVEGGTIFQTPDGNVWINKASREWKRRALRLSKNGSALQENVVSYRYSPEKQPPETIIQPHHTHIIAKSQSAFQWTGEDYQFMTPKNKLSFSYRLNQETWSPFTAENSQNFENLPAGSYTLEVRARDGDMNVDPTPANIHFRVKIPIWQQTWVILFAVFILSVFLIFFLWLNIRNRYPLSDRTAQTTPPPTPPEMPEKEEPEFLQPPAPELTAPELKPAPVLLTSSDEKLLHLLSEIMEENLSDANFNVNKMCEMVNLSHMHFIRKVKQLTGMKPQEMLRSFRMKRARDLLSQNKVNIAEVSYMVGYDLPNSFTRAFKKEFGVTPTEFLDDIKHQTQ